MFIYVFFLLLTAAAGQLLPVHRPGFVLFVPTGSIPFDSLDWNFYLYCWDGVSDCC